MHPCHIPAGTITVWSIGHCDYLEFGFFLFCFSNRHMDLRMHESLGVKGGHKKDFPSPVFPHCIRIP